MNHALKFFSNGMAGLLIVLAFSTTAAAQNPSQPKATEKRSTAGRDPFRRYEPPKVVVKKSNVVMPPSIEERIAQYRLQKQAAMSARIQPPKPTTALLLGETQVIGISRTPRGYAAIVEATPIKMSFVIYPGERFYDGQLVAIEDNRLVFRREVVFTDGRRERTVELKPLRQPSPVDTLASVKSVPAPAATVEAGKTAETSAAPSKP